MSFPFNFKFSNFFSFSEDESAVVDDSSSKVVAPPPVTRQKAAKAAAPPPPPSQLPSLCASSFCLEGVQYILVDGTGRPVSSLLSSYPFLTRSLQLDATKPKGRGRFNFGKPDFAGTRRFPDDLPGLVKVTVEDARRLLNLHGVSFIFLFPYPLFIHFSQPLEACSYCNNEGHSTCLVMGDGPCYGCVKGNVVGCQHSVPIDELIKMSDGDLHRGLRSPQGDCHFLSLFPFSYFIF